MNINSLTASLKALFAVNNTTTATYDLSENLTGKRVQTIISGVAGSHAEVPIPLVGYPAVIVEAATSAQEHTELGNNARRDIDIVWDVYAITHYGAGSGDERAGRQAADSEVLELTANMERLIRNNIRLSNTVDWCIVETVDYGAQVGDKTYNAVAKMSIKAHVRS